VNLHALGDVRHAKVELLLLALFELWLCLVGQLVKLLRLDVPELPPPIGNNAFKLSVTFDAALFLSFLRMMGPDLLFLLIREFCIGRFLFETFSDLPFATIATFATFAALAAPCHSDEKKRDSHNWS